MTREELNRKMAEFMGWHEFCDLYADKDGNEVMRIEDWNPAESISDAWMLVNRMNEQGNSVCIWEYPELKNGYKSVCFYGQDEFGGWEFATKAETAPMAICLTVLKVMEGE